MLSSRLGQMMPRTLSEPGVITTACASVPDWTLSAFYDSGVPDEISEVALSPEVEMWVAEHVELAGAIRLFCERPWGTVWQVPVVDGVVWLKVCAPGRTSMSSSGSSVSGVCPR